MIAGRNSVYITAFLDGVFSGGGASGMRLSVYCSDKMAFAKDGLIEQQYRVYPFMQGAGYYLNDVNRGMCKCWNVSPIADEDKEPFYSNVPALLGGGELDPACRPIYNDMIHHYLPNSQRLHFLNQSHGPLIRRDGNVFIGDFLERPYAKIVTDGKYVKAY